MLNYQRVTIIIMAVIFPFGEESQPHSCRPRCLCKVGQCPMSFIKAVRWSPPNPSSDCLAAATAQCCTHNLSLTVLFLNMDQPTVSALWPCLDFSFFLRVFGSNMFQNIPKPPGSKPSFMHVNWNKCGTMYGMWHMWPDLQKWDFTGSYWLHFWFCLCAMARLRVQGHGWLARAAMVSFLLAFINDPWHLSFKWNVHDFCPAKSATFFIDWNMLRSSFVLVPCCQFEG